MIVPESDRLRIDGQRNGQEDGGRRAQRRTLVALIERRKDAHNASDARIWFDPITRERAMLLTLVALGAGPASFLARRLDRVIRLALAPALGLCVGAAVDDHAG
jgi:hypothetical protein